MFSAHLTLAAIPLEYHKKVFRFNAEDYALELLKFNNGHISCTDVSKYIVYVSNFGEYWCQDFKAIA